MFAAKMVYSAHILPKDLYCSAPALKISDTMAQKFEKLKDKAHKIIYHQIDEGREDNLSSISNHKK